MDAIPQTSPGAAVAERRDEYETAIASVLGSGQYILGPSVARFEQAFASFVGVAHAVGVANGTDALELALRALGVGPGDAVFTVSHTATATAAAIVRTGATPVLVDVDPGTFTMDPERLGAAVTAVEGILRPAAVVPVHLYGAVADMRAILEVAQDAGLRVVEDCAQAHGAMRDGAMAGTFGDAAAFSFYPTKNLAALGDGGAVVTDDADVADAIRELRQYGWRERYVSSRHGINSRLDEIQAAILMVGLAHLAEDNARRRAVADAYTNGLADLGLALPFQPPTGTHAFHQYVIRTERRAALREACAAAGISTAVHYPLAIHQQPAYGTGAVIASALPVTESLVGEIVSLPMFPQLTPGHVERVVTEVRRAVAAPR